MFIRCFLRYSMLHLNLQFKLGYNYKRQCSSVQCCEKLLQRQLIQLSGPETSFFLQGLMTNDMRHLETNLETSVTLPCIYSMLLNHRGDVLYDSIVYKVPKHVDKFLLECDASLMGKLVNHLKMYRMRKKISIELMGDSLQVWAIFTPITDSQSDTLHSLNEHSRLSSSSVLQTVEHDAIVVAARDPRLSLLGHRLVLRNDADLSSLLPSGVEQCMAGGGSKYARHRYFLGVGEGVKDHPPSSCLPLECNVDYLHGVSFHKGCYVGQELTARTHHTGVVRKRLMPVVLKDQTDQVMVIPGDSIIVNEKGKTVGKVRHFEGCYGLAILRIEECLKARELVIKDLNVKLEAVKPSWWPVQIAKESSRAA